MGLSDALAHYGQGRPVSSPELERAAQAAGLTGTQLRTVMYELSQPLDLAEVRHPTRRR